jgi:hypothetical protein
MLNAFLETIGTLGVVASIAAKIVAGLSARAPVRRDRTGS